MITSLNLLDLGSTFNFMNLKKVTPSITIKGSLFDRKRTFSPNSNLTHGVPGVPDKELTLKPETLPLNACSIEV